MKSHLPKISIITPSLNQGSFIEQTIQSVVNQDYPNLEYIIVDGGSTDKTLKIIKKYARKYPKIIKWQSQQDKGQVDAINKGFMRSTGEIVAYINSDDYYLPRAFKKIALHFQLHPKCLWVVGNCRITSKNLRWTFKLKHIWPIHKSKIALEIFNTVNQPSTFLSKKLIKKVGVFNPDYHFAFDYEYWLRCAKVKLPERLFSDLAVFRTHKLAKGNSNFATQFAEDLDIISIFASKKISLLTHKIIKNITVFSYRYLKS